ncbi:hypothetical protein BC833DRAFT_588860, partial [Globomyces pollinis-pini]
MRVGRLQSTTLENIWKSLEPSLDSKNLTLATDPIQKQYIPTTADSPLFRLISITASAEELLEEESRLQQPIDRLPSSENMHNGVQTNGLDFVTRGPMTHRGMSVPEIVDTGLDHVLPLPRVVGSSTSLLSNNISRQPSQLNNPIPETTTFTRPVLTSVDISARIPPTIGSSQTSTHSLRLISERSATNLGNHPQLITGQSHRNLSFTINNKLNSSPDAWLDEYSHIDIDWSMQAMDALHSAAFYDYIRDESNVELSAIRLCRIIKDYKPRQVANALLWMIQGWSIEGTSRLLKTIFADWLPDLAGCVFSLISRTWPKQPQCSLCCAFLLMAEPSNSTALFLRSLTQSWSRRESIELITYLDSVLKWDNFYLQEVITLYSNISNNTFTKKNVESEVMLHKEEKNKEEQESNIKLSMANENLMLANAKLAVAEYQLAIFNHWSNCPDCQSKKECKVIEEIKIPDYYRMAESSSDMTMESFRDSLNNLTFQSIRNSIGHGCSTNGSEMSSTNSLFEDYCQSERAELDTPPLTRRIILDSKDSSSKLSRSSSSLQVLLETNQFDQRTVP